VSKDSTVYDNACLPDDKTMEKNMHIAGAVAVGVGALASLVFVTNVVRARDSQTIERIMFDTEASPWTTCLAGLGKLDLGVQTASGKFENRSLGKERTVRLNLADLGYGERIEQTALRQVPLTANFDGLYEVDGHIDLAVVRKEEQARVQREADLENGARHWPVVLSEARLVEACDEGSRWVAARSWTDTMTTMCKIVRKVAKDTRWLSQERLPVHRALVDFPGLGDAERDLVESDRESSRFYQTLVLDRAHGATRRVPPEFVKAYPKELMRQACRTACLAGRNDSEAPRDLDCRTSCLVDIP
jgi:hypothetical protein